MRKTCLKLLMLSEHQRRVCLIMETDFDVCPLPPFVVLQLMNSAQSLPQYTSQNELSPCPHLYYPSIQMFVDHILWVLRQYEDPDIYVLHNQVLIRLMRNLVFCGHCRNILISSTKMLEDLCSADKMITHSRSQVYRSSSELRQITWSRLFEHPKMPRVMMQICRDSVAAFRSICTSLHSLAQFTLSDEDVSKTDLYHIFEQYSCFIYMTVKYWNEDQIKYFVMNHLGRPSMHMRSEVTPSRLLIFDNIAYLMYLKSKQARLRARPPVRKAELVSYLECSKAFRREVNAEERRWLCCSSLQCNKAQKDSSRQFKLCGGCKLTYYCSRSCQKRAWPQHKPVCLMLRRLYAL